MKNLGVLQKLTTLLIVLLFSVNIFASIPKKWQGQAKGKRFYIETDGTKEGTTLTSPELWIENSKCDTLAIDGMNFYATFNYGQLKAKGHITSSFDEISVMINYSNSDTHVLLNPVNEMQPIYWAQNPVAPFPYLEEEKTITINDSITLSGTLTIPNGKGKYNAVVIVSGTGQQDRDATFNGHRPFALIADYLTRMGMAVLRIDDRGTGKSTGVYDDATTWDFASDALKAVELLKADNRINKKHIGLLGHSEGGAVVMIAATESKDVDFVISVAGLMTDGLTSLKLQNEAIIRSYPGKDKQWYSANIKFLFNLFDWVYAVPDNEKLTPQVTADFHKWTAQQDDATLAACGLKDREDMFILRYLYHAEKPWYRRLMHYNPADYLPKVKVPVLAINGDKDIMVPSTENLSTAKRLLTLGGNKNVTTVSLPGVNHMMQHCDVCDQAEIPTLDEVFATEALQLIGDWIKKNVK